MSQLDLKLKIIPSKTQICMMCHFSSECENCCNECKTKCNQRQMCGFKNEFGDQADRLESWLHIIKIPAFRRLRKFIVQ